MTIRAAIAEGAGEAYPAGARATTKVYAARPPIALANVPQAMSTTVIVRL